MGVLLKEEFALLVFDYLEHGHSAGVFHAAIGAGLIKLVGAETCSSRW